MRHRRDGEQVAPDVVAPFAVELTSECEDFLRGSYLESLCEEGREVPYWAWLSALAYRPVGELKAVLDDRRRWSRRPELLPWWHALRAIAEEIDEAAARVGVAPAALQETVLVRFQLLSNAVHFGPAGLARAVSGALTREVRRIESERNRARA
jgi:hypothetical protein